MLQYLTGQGSIASQQGAAADALRVPSFSVHCVRFKDGSSVCMPLCESA